MARQGRTERLAESPLPPRMRVAASALCTTPSQYFVNFNLLLHHVSVCYPSQMSNPKEIIASAFEKLKRSISDEDAHNFASTELKDVWSAVGEIDSKQRKRLSAQNLRRIEPLLRGIEKYAKVVEVLCNGTPFLPYVWVRTPSLNSAQ